ncbi:unnamed protein product, partial [Musa acuminata subsp. burmannicoides]
DRIDLQGSKTHMGGTMRLGSRRTFFTVADCKSAKLYGKVSFVDERHRHRYEVNPDMVPEFEKAGLAFVGKGETGKRMEIIELPSHPYYVGVQFHPEFKSRPGKPSAVFLGLIAASCRQLDSWLQASNGQISPAAPHAHSNGYPSPRTYRNGGPAVKSLVNGGSFHSNGNGLHVHQHSST